jgi:endonuclease/exonuclease/phosphatase family metal-dependent hydrolase
MKVIVFTLMSFLLVPLITIGKGDSNKKDQSATINIISYNVRMNTQSDGVNAWPLRKDKVIGLLNFHKPDLFGIQEGLPEQVADLAVGLPDFENVGVGRDDGKSEGEHMSIFYRKSRFQKIDWGTFWLNEATDKPGFGWDAVCNRTCTWIKLKDLESKKTFYYFNTHFDHRGKVARVEAAKLILKFMKEINSEHLPVVLTGDFNSVKENEPIQILLTELKDTRSICASAPYGPEGSSGGFEVKPHTRIIDYIFANDRVVVLRHGILTDSNGLYYHSDHLPVLAEIAFQ